MKMNKITIIVPVHEFNDEIKKYFDVLMKSIDLQEQNKEKPEVLIVHKPDIPNIDLNSTNKNIRLLANPGDTNYQSQVNFAVQNITTEFFTVVEFDDELSVTFLKNVEEHIEAYPKVDVFLPMIIETSVENRPVKITNEPVWSQQFIGENGEMGYLNDTLLKQYSDFKLSGAVVRKKSFVNCGGYKTNIELTFMYEFLLRALNNGLIIYTIPKIIYKHLVGREGALFHEYSEKMSMKDRKFWFDIAGKEYVFLNQREIAPSV
jgi:hypothetical protein